MRRSRVCVLVLLHRNKSRLRCHDPPLYFGSWCSATKLCQFAAVPPFVMEIHMLTAEQMLAAQKANVETLFGLTTKAFEGVEKLVELNVTATKAALVEAAETSQSLLSVKDAQELLALQAALFQPLAEKTSAYSRH